MKKPVRIVVDGHEFTVDGTTHLLQAVLGTGKNLPYFCWHPELGSVGACRQCAVIQYKDETDTQGRMVMACMTPCTEGARLSVEHPDAKDMRASVVEFLMTNHPHDCPVCEEGGHCHLQDMTVMTGHNYRRYRHTKRTHRNQDLGPFVSHEMNRCIACYRCVRFYKDYAGGRDLDVQGTGADVYFGRAADGTLESPFSGNLVEVCPTGVFTDKPYGESYTRKWDLQTSPSVCAGCSIGCNITPGERYGQLKRVENRYHGEINGYFICDRGRYGAGYVNRTDRPRQVLVRRGDALQPASAEDAIAQVAALVKQGRVLGIGSPRASLETNAALRALVGPANFSTGQSRLDAELTRLAVDVLRRGPARIATVRDAEQADAVFVLGEDVLATGARLALALRQSTRQAGLKLAAQAHIPAWQDASVRTLAQDLRSPLFVASSLATGLDELATEAFRGAPDEVARLGFAVAHALDGGAPIVNDLDAKTLALAARIAQALLAAERPLVVSGTNTGSAEILRAAAAVSAALAKAGRAPLIALLFAEANSAGVSLLGGLSVEEALARAGDADTLIVAENDLARRVPAARLDAAGKIRNRVVLDCIAGATTARATVLLPAGSFAESDGTLVNFEGRAQRYFQTFVAQGAMRESWRWLQQIAAAAGVQGLGDTLDTATAAAAQAAPALADIIKAAPNAKFRMAGARIPRESHRYSGRTAMHANRDIHEPRPPHDADSPLSFSMEGATGLKDRPSTLTPMFWYPQWNSPQAINKFQDEIGGHLRGGDPGVRLFAAGTTPASYATPPRGDGRGLYAVPLHHLFGSEELSAQAPVMATRMAAPYFAVSAALASQVQLQDGARAELNADGVSLSLPVRIVAGMAENCVGVPAGIAGVPAIPPGVQVALVPAAPETARG
ncbi:MAG TPA: NADH-quinone oxidoreductase subunit NuoG [Candidatus Binatia bacterium]|nr:NADH-quinone oxidoreductase subunit NuoG [Candidatus Binatia bacterium]